MAKKIKRPTDTPIKIVKSGVVSVIKFLALSIMLAVSDALIVRKVPNIKTIRGKAGSFTARARFTKSTPAVAISNPL